MVVPEADSYHTWGDGKMVILAYTTIITIGGLLGNSLVIFLFVYFKTLRTVTNNFIVNLAVCNLALAILELVFSLPALFASDWIFGDVLAIFYAFAYFLLVSVSMVMLAVIAVDRYHVISRPKLRTRISGTKSLLVIVVVYVYTLAIASPILYAPTGLQVKMHISGCYIDFTPSSNFGSGSYAVVIVSLLYVVPLVTMVYYYWNIFKVLRDRRKGPAGKLANGRGKLANGRPREDHTRARPASTRPASTYTIRNTPMKTLRVIATLVTFFIVTWMPFMIITVGRAFNQRATFDDKAKEIVILLSKSVIVINPVVYALVNHRFQKCVAKLFCGAQVVIGATTTEHSVDFNGFTRSARGSTQESRRSRCSRTRSRLSSSPDVFTPESFTPGRQSTLRHSYSDSQLGKHACIAEESNEETEADCSCNKNTEKDRFLKLAVNESARETGNWEIYVTSF